MPSTLETMSTCVAPTATLPPAGATTIGGGVGVGESPGAGDGIGCGDADGGGAGVCRARPLAVNARIPPSSAMTATYRSGRDGAGLRDGGIFIVSHR